MFHPQPVRVGLWFGGFSYQDTAAKEALPPLSDTAPLIRAPMGLQPI